MNGKLYTAEEIMKAIKHANFETIDSQPSNRCAATAALIIGEFIDSMTEALEMDKE